MPMKSWACNFCEKSFLHFVDAEEHEKTCNQNPKNRCCETCCLNIEIYPQNSELPFVEMSCVYGGTYPDERNCKMWEPKDDKN